MGGVKGPKKGLKRAQKRGKRTKRVRHIAVQKDGYNVKMTSSDASLEIIPGPAGVKSQGPPAGRLTARRQRRMVLPNGILSAAGGTSGRKWALEYRGFGREHRLLKGPPGAKNRAKEGKKRCGAAQDDHRAS